MATVVKDFRVTGLVVSGTTATVNGSQVLVVANKAAANGVASLDAGTKIPIAQIPTGTSSSTVSLGDHTHAGSGNYQTLYDDGAAQTQRLGLNLISGNQITVTNVDNSGANRSDVTIDVAASPTFTNLTVSGTLTVNGTTTTVNSTTVTVDDPVFTIGGDTAPVSDDNKDRGIEFRWHNGSAAKVGFFGFDDSTGYLTFIPDATNTSEVFSGTVGTANFNTTGSAATLASARNIAITGDLAWNINFDGSGNVTAAGTLATVNSNVGSYGDSVTVATFTVNAKGLITAAGGTAIRAGSTSQTGILQLTDSTSSTSTTTAATPNAVKSAYDLANAALPKGGGTMTGAITLRTGAAGAGNAPLYFVSGTNLTAAVAGAMEFDGTNLYFTPVSTRKTVAFTDSNITGTAANVTGTVVVANGGTGATTFTAGYLKASAQTAFTTVSSIPGSDVSGNISGNAANVTGTVTYANGGTGQTTWAQGDLLYASAANTLGKLTKGSANQLLGMNNGATVQEYKTLNGTSNRVTVTHAANSITLDIPATPTIQTGLNIDANANITAIQTSLATAATPYTADQWTPATYKAVKYIVSLSTATNTHITEVLVARDSSNNVHLTVYGEVYTSASLATIDADYDGSTYIRLRITPANNTTDCKVIRMALA